MFDDAMKEVLKGKRLRKRGKEPTLSDAEVLTMETVGEFMGISQDKGLFLHFRRYYSHFFPGIKKIHRTTFIRQAANLFKVKELLWKYFLNQIECDPTLSIVDSLPVYACQFARAYRCVRFKGKASFGKDILIRQTFYGFRIHVRLVWPGVVSCFSLAPANEHETKVVPELVNDTTKTLVGDRNYWSPCLKEELYEYGIFLEATYRSAKRDPYPKRSKLLSRIRYRIDTVFGQLTERYQIKKVWAKDMWHLCSPLLRKIISHTLAFRLNQILGNPPLQFDKLLA